MSVSYYAHTVIGVKLAKSDVNHLKIIRGCSCKVSGEPKFCPNCGKQFKIETCDPCFEDGQEIKGLTVATDTDSRNYYLGITANSGEYSNGSFLGMEYLSTEKLLDIKNRIDTICQHYDIRMADKKFGVWTFLSCS